MTLRGPADAERFRVKYRGARYYIDPLEPCDILPEVPQDRLPSFTAIKSLHSKVFKKKTEYGTHELTAVRAAKYVAENAEHLLQLDQGGILAAVASAPALDLAQAGNRGTQIHLLLEAKLKGHDLDKRWVEMYAPLAMPYVDAIEAWWADQQPEALYAEVVGLNWEHGYAFTSDVLGLKLRSFGDRVLAADWKTRGPDANHGAYFEEGMQLAAAACSEYIFVDQGDGRIVRARPPHVDGGVVVSIKPESVEMYEVDLDKAWDGWTRTCAGWRLRQEAASLGNKAVSNKPVFVQPALPLPGHGADEVAGGARPEDGAGRETPPSASAGDGSTPSLAAVPSSEPIVVQSQEGPLVVEVDRQAKATHLRERILALSDDGKRSLAAAWPADLMTFGAARREWAEMTGVADDFWNQYTADDLRAAEKAIQTAERESGAPFPDDTDDGEPTVAGDSALVVELAKRWAALPPNRQPTIPAGMTEGLAKLRQVEAFANELAEAEQALDTAIENYRKGNREIVVADDTPPKDVLKAGREAAKALMLPPPKGGAPGVRENPHLWRAVS